ncbi:MAG: sodium:solute symporter [Bacteroidota bacterium]|jgi:Na+/proline symporter|nr:sodium:solute symporter [Bacteroidota bacterium]
MSPLIIVLSIFGYFGLLMMIAWYTSRNAGNEAYFLGNKASPWYAVAFGMIGDSLSGVTFISLPGTVTTNQFSYMQLVLGYLMGYFIIAKVLLPVYYRLNLTSIYSYLQGRFGDYSQKTGSFYFLISRIIGAALRLFLAAGVLHFFIFRDSIPFVFTVAIIIILMLLYTYRGGIKTLVWTDTLQSGLLLLGVILSITAIMSQLDMGLADVVTEVNNSRFSKIFFWDWKEKNYFFKQFFSGAFIAVVMTGLDQNMMQKNLSCKSLGDAQKNIYWFSIVLVIVNLFFVSLGAMLYLYAEKQGISLPVDPTSGKIITDQVFPSLALNNLGIFAAIVFIIGLTAATFSSADSVLTTLTTSFCIDFLKMDESIHSEEKKTKLRHWVHIGFAVVLLITIVMCEMVPKTSVLDAIFTVAAYTYGPLLGLFTFGLFTKMKVKDKWVPLVSVFSVVISYLLRENSEQWLNGYKFGYELLLLNGLLTFLGLWIISDRSATK